MRSARSTVTGMLVGPAIAIGVLAGAAQAAHAATPVKDATSYAPVRHDNEPAWGRDRDRDGDRDRGWGQGRWGQGRDWRWDRGWGRGWRRDRDWRWDQRWRNDPRWYHHR